MPQFMVIGRDGADGLERRKIHRPAHLAYWGKLFDEGKVFYAGPMLDVPGGKPIGSVIILEAKTLEAAQALAQGDPYVPGGVFATTELRPMMQTLPKP
jgi:uncharacterized protein YciI